MPSLSHQLSPVQLSPVGSIVLPFGDSRNYRTDMERSFAEWMNRELLRRDWNQSDLVRRTGLSSSTLSRFATGKRIPSPKQADLIADVLGVDLDTVLAVAGHRPNPDPDDPPKPILPNPLTTHIGYAILCASGGGAPGDDREGTRT